MEFMVGFRVYIGFAKKSVSITLENDKDIYCWSRVTNWSDIQKMTHSISNINQTQKQNTQVKSPQAYSSFRMLYKTHSL